MLNSTTLKRYSFLLTLQLTSSSLKCTCTYSTYSKLTKILLELIMIDRLVFVKIPSLDKSYERLIHNSIIAVSQKVNL